MTREEIKKQIADNKAKIKSLQIEIGRLTVESHKLCDDKQRYEEGYEEVQVSGRPKKFETVLRGRIFYDEDFEDEDTGEVVTINRQRIVMENNEWYI